jgi:1,2-diacylglycerol 3-alpha-glucosyltransferase
MSATDRLRIAFVCDTLHSSSGGGILSGEYVVDRLRQHHDVVAVGADGDSALPGFQLPFRAMRESSFVMARPDRQVLANSFADAQIVHLQFPFWLSFAALDEARKMGLPVVAGFHIQPENMLFNVGIHSDWLNKGIYRTLVKHFFDKVDAVVCPTPFAEEKLRKYGLKTRTVVISNGVSPDVAEMVRKAPPRRRDPDGKFLILAVGRLAAEKRQDVIIEAVRRSRHKDQIRLVLSGAGPKEAELKELASALPNGAEIGFLPRETLLQRFTEADLFVHASEVELEGMAVLEAMGASVPTLVANAPESAAARFALDQNWSFPTGDAWALSARIDALIENPSELDAARDAYRVRAKQFDFDASVDKLVGVYRSVIAGRAQAGTLRQSA